MASSQDRVARLLLRIQSEQQSVQRVKQQLASFEGEFQRFKTESERVNVALEKQVSVLQRQKIAAAQAEKATQTVANAERKLRTEVQQTTAAQAQANAQGGRRAALSSIGREVRALPAVPIPGTGITTDVVGKLTQVLAGLPPAALAGAAAVTALTVAVTIMKSNFERAKEQIERSIEANRRFNELRVTGTRKAIEAELDALQIRRQITELNLKQETDRLGNVAAAVTAGTDLGNTLQFIAASLNIGEAELVATIAAVGESKKALENINQEIDIYTQALGLSEVALRDATAAQEALNRAFMDMQSDVSLRQLQTRLSLEGQNAQQVRDRLAAIQREITLTQESLRTSVLSAEATERLQNAITLLSAEEQELARALPEKERIEAAANAFERIKESIGNFVEEAQRRAADFQKAVKAIGDLRAGFDDRLADIERRRQEAIADAATTRDQDIIKARRDSAIAEAEAVRKAGLDREKIELESLQRQAAIVRRAKFSIENAIQDRDAVSLDLARRTRKNELDEEKSSRRERLRELDSGLKEEIRTIRRRLSQQVLTIDESYSEQVRRATLAAQRAVAVETQKFQKELVIRTQALQAALRIEQRGAQAHLNLQANFWGNSLKLAASAVQQLGNMRVQAARVQQFNTTRPSPTGRGGGFAPSLQTGGRVLSDGLVFAHAGEMFVNPRRGQGMNFTFAPQIKGATIREMRQHVNEEFDRFVIENF